MAITRRDFLKYSAVTGAGLLFGVFDLKPIVAYAQANPPVWTSEAISVCGYCSVGCSMIVGSPDTGNLAGYVTYVQGYPDNPINLGSLCSKGSASAQLSTIVSDDSGTRIPNPGRLIAVKHRAPYATNWDTTYMTMDEAISRIAAKVKATRDATFVEYEGTLKVNRCEGIASLGASSFNNEPAYLLCKSMRALGVVYLETQARN